MTDAQDRGWGPGWPNCQDEKWVVIGHVDGIPDAVWDIAKVHQRLAPLVRMLLAETARRGYVFKTDPRQNWGAACREVRGSNPAVPSNHSWGLALDFNSARNPLGSDPAKSDIPGWMVALWDEYGFFWGGKFQSRKDPMHFEFMGTPEDADRLTKKAREEGLGEDRMTDAEKAKLDSALELARVANARLEGMVARLKGEKEPADQGPKRQGYRMAEEFLSKPAIVG